MIDSEILLGGHPQWQQDAQYLSCPKCGKTMKYLAQIPFGALIDVEGTIYMQICDECEVIGANFQCTQRLNRRDICCKAKFKYLLA